MNLDSCFKDKWNPGEKNRILFKYLTMLRRSILEMIQEITNSYICSDDGLYDMLIDVWAIFTNRLISLRQNPREGWLDPRTVCYYIANFLSWIIQRLINWNVEADETHKSCLSSMFSSLRTRRLEINVILLFLITFFNFV